MFAVSDAGSTTTSRGSSPVTVGSPLPGGGFFNANSGNSNNSSGNSLTAGIASTGKPPLFLSTVGSQHYVDASALPAAGSTPHSTSSVPNNSGGNVSGMYQLGGARQVQVPVPLRPASADVHAHHSALAGSAPLSTAPVLAFVHTAPSTANSASSTAEGAAGAAAPSNAMFPAIRSHTPSPVPGATGSSATQATHSTTGATSANMTPSAGTPSTYTPLFNPVSPGKPPSGVKGMVLSNSMDNFLMMKEELVAGSNSSGLLKSALQGQAPRPVSATIPHTSADNNSVGSSSSSVASSTVGGPATSASLGRKGSSDNLTDMTFTRMTAPLRAATKPPSPKSAAAARGIAREDSSWADQRRDSNASNGDEEAGLSDPLRAPGSAGRNSRNKRAQRPSLAEQLAHLSTDAPAAGAKTTDEVNSSSGVVPGSQASFFSQSLNSHIAVGRSAHSSPSPQDFAQQVEGRCTPDSAALLQPVPPSPNNTLYALPAKAFSIGSQSCRQPSRVCFFCDRAEYTFYPPSPGDSAALSLALYYTDMSAISTVGTKLRFKIPARAVEELVHDAALNSLLLVSVELTSSASMAIVRDRVIPLVVQAKG
jgi:hypothetical protein